MTRRNRTFRLADNVSVRGVPAAEVNALLMQPQIHVVTLATVNGLAAEVTIDGLDLRWQVLSLQMGENEWQVMLAHSAPEGQWTGLIRPPKFESHPAPNDRASMVKWCRWFFAPKAAL